LSAWDFGRLESLLGLVEVQAGEVHGLVDTDSVSELDLPEVIRRVDELIHTLQDVKTLLRREKRSRV
jgi:hypothetical protein